MKRIYTLLAIAAAATASALEVTLPAAGTLKEYISPEQQETVTELKISGDINGDDLRIIRHMIGAQVSSPDGSYTEVDSGACRVLDLADARIVSGGCYAFRTIKNSNGSLRYLHYLQPRADAIGYAMFIGSKIEELTLPRSVKYIGSETETDFSRNPDFYLKQFGDGSTIKCSCIDGSNLRHLTLPDNLEHFKLFGSIPVKKQEIIDGIAYDYYTNIYQSNLLNSPKLAEIKLAESNNCYKVVEGVLYSGDLSVLMFCPPAIVNSIVASDAYQEVGSFACRGAKVCGDINIEQRVGTRAFQRAEIDGNVSVRSRRVADYAFSNSRINGIVSLLEQCDTVGEHAFDGATAAGLASLPTSMRAITDYAFAHTTIGGGIDIHEGIDSLGQGCFNFNMFETIRLAKLKKFHTEVTDAIDDYEGDQFFGQDLIYGSRMFLASQGLRELTIGKDVEIIPQYLFQACDNLRKINFDLDGELRVIGKGAFTANLIDTLILPKKILYVENNSFLPGEEASPMTLFIPAYPLGLPSQLSYIGNYYSAPYIDYELKKQCKEIYLWGSDDIKEDVKRGASSNPECRIYVNDGSKHKILDYIATLPDTYWITSVPEENWIERKLLDYPNYEPAGNSVETISLDKSPAIEVARYDIMGRAIQEPQPGLNIVVYSDGQSKKQFVK